MRQELLDTLHGIEFQANDLRQNLIDELFSLELIWSEWSDYGIKLSDAGTALLNLKYYHMCPTRLIDSILQNGIVPASRTSELFSYTDKRAYLWTSLYAPAIDGTLVGMFDENGFEPYTMLEIDGAMLDDFKFTNDECMAGKIAVYTGSTIPANALRVIGSAISYA